MTTTPTPQMRDKEFVAFLSVYSKADRPAGEWPVEQMKAAWDNAWRISALTHKENDNG